MISNPITLEALVVIDAIETRGSFASAAEQLNKVPSALSYIVQKLEEQLGVTLFEKQGRRSVLTPAGRHLLEEGRKVMTSVNTLSEQTRTIANGWESKIRIAVDSIFETSKLFECLNSFLQQHPNIEIDIREEVMNGGWEAIIDDKVDLVIGAPAPMPQQKGLRGINICNVTSSLMVNNDHPLTKLQRSVTLSDLKPYRTVVVHDSAKFNIPWSINIVEQSSRFYVSSVVHKISAIKAGIGIGFLPTHIVKSELEAGELVCVDVEDSSRKIEHLMAWKLTNRGLGLKRLREMIEQSFAEKRG
ncbi:MAG: LysR family transcriptional regulator [Gammaproteobacteria bacterium]|nr:LysR family transcriptional regulator [Gammaproteobacteria bacterium]